LSGLSLAIGAVIVSALQGLGLVQARVKWPNDIVLEGEKTPKLAGVLIELSGDMLGPSAAVIGVGINFRGGDVLTRALGQPVTDLFATLGPLDRNEVFLTLLAALDAGLERFEQEGFAAFHAQWDACHVHQGREVSVLTGQGGCISGQALGVDEYGALLLKTPAGVRRFHSGEVSLRGEEG
jgi:BirA family biotin operon repressor/biotin-[acetyl-CoA-carboxylase] ligase